MVAPVPVGGLGVLEDDLVVWQIDVDHPHGFARPMTADEFEQWQTDQTAAAEAESIPAPLSLQERVATELEAIPDGPITKQQISGVIAALLAD